MHIIIVTNYRRKAFLLAAIIFFQVLMFFTGDLLLRNSLLLNITIDNCMEFSYPLDIAIDDIYASEQAEDVSVQSSAPFSRPVARQFSNYKSLEGKFSFDYPSAFILVPQELSGAEILYHIGFHAKSDADHGFVQVWNMPGTLEEFLKNARKTSQQTYRYFKSGSIKVNGVPGYYWDYSVLTDSGYYKGNEVFLKKEGRMYRISYFVPEADWNKNRLELFRNMVRSFKIL